MLSEFNFHTAAGFNVFQLISVCSLSYIFFRDSDVWDFYIKTAFHDKKHQKLFKMALLN